jgi:hypothetical protein
LVVSVIVVLVEDVAEMMVGPLVPAASAAVTATVHRMVVLDFVIQNLNGAAFEEERLLRRTDWAPFLVRTLGATRDGVDVFHSEVVLCKKLQGVTRVL